MSDRPVPTQDDFLDRMDEQTFNLSRIATALEGIYNRVWWTNFIIWYAALLVGVLVR